MRLLIITLSLAFTSCALTSKFEYGQHRYFNNALTEKEKAEIEKSGTITKHWVGTNNLGDSLIGDVLVKKGNPYEFVEIGDWREKSLVTRNDNSIGNFNRELKYDQSGNLISMKGYFKKRDAGDYFLVEQMESTIDSQGLKQTYKGFYDTGELQYQYTMLVTDYNTVKSDHLRKKEVAEPIKYFDKNGGQVSQLPIEPVGGISKFTKME